jgi:DNA mismatch repair protein MutS2
MDAAGGDPGCLAHTLEALDWAVIREALGERCLTPRGRAIAMADTFAQTPQTALRWLSEVKELWLLDNEGEHPPISALHDIEDVAYRAAKGEVLEPHELMAAGISLGAMARLSQWVNGRTKAIPLLVELASGIDIDIFLLRNLEDSFDASGELSDTHYPDLRQIRSRMDQLKATVRERLNQLLNDPTMDDAFHDRYITDRSGRLVIPVRVSARKRLGIVHDTSQSGETAFVEPSIVVDQQNEIKQLEAELRRTVARILAEISREVGQAHSEIASSLAAATQIDLAQARARLGIALNGTIPSIGTQGQAHIVEARHPVLTLRGLDVIPNTLIVDDTHSGVVLTGPNAGGKTITLKSIGLMAMMVRAGLPIPASDGARVDWFSPIIAVVGDQQDVSEDLSTFSSHLVGLRSAIETAAPGALILLDEIGIGTDPAQGAALAAAVIEHIVSSGARAIVTTHYTEIKKLAAEHPQMTLMGAVFADGRPTFRMEPGRVGRSHALAVARHMGLPEPVIQRARALLDTEARRMDDLLTQVESEREELLILRAALEDAQRASDFERSRIAERETKLNARRDREDARDREAFRDRLTAVETDIKAKMKELQAAPDMRSAAKLLDDVKQHRADAQSTDPPLPQADTHPLSPGDRVKLLNLGTHGTVESTKGDQIVVDVRGKHMRLDRAGLRYAPANKPKPPARITEGSVSRSPDGVRTEGNTLDLRGMRVEEALEAVEDFLVTLSLSDHGCGYLLHGHGTGALKSALRRWLPSTRYGKKWRVGGADEGGDAFTVVVF